MQWELLKYYHPSDASVKEARVPAADSTVQKKLQQVALFKKIDKSTNLNIGVI